MVGDEDASAGAAFASSQWRQSSVAPAKDRNNNKRPPNKGINRFAWCILSGMLFGQCLSVQSASSKKERHQFGSFHSSASKKLPMKRPHIEAPRQQRRLRRAVNDSLALPCKWTLAADRNGMQTTLASYYTFHLAHKKACNSLCKHKTKKKTIKN